MTQQLQTETEPADPAGSVSELWFTRCPVPTATGIAADLGWLREEFTPDGIEVRSLQDVPRSTTNNAHFEHGLDVLFREGGNVPALWTRARGAETRLIGLTWIEERQAILVRADDPADAVGDLAGRRVAVPRRPIAIDFWRAMALHGFAGALGTVGLGLSDLVPVDINGPETGDGANQLSSQWEPELTALLAGTVDAVYVKGAVGVEAGAMSGARVLLDLDRVPSRRSRINNGTPRPITVHHRLLDERPDLVARFLSVLLRAADWAADHPSEVARILSDETGAGAAGVNGAYRDDYHRRLHPDLSDERLALLDEQQRFLAEHGFIERPVDVRTWADPTPLAEARALLDSSEPSPTS